MKNITADNVKKLRESILREHDKFMEEYTIAIRLLGEERDRMVERLGEISEEIDRILETSETLEEQVDQVQALFREINELRVYFGAPTGRPLEDPGVEFVGPYIATLRLLFRFSQSMKLYVEMIRTDLALLEYRLEHQQDIEPCLDSLIDNMELLQTAARFTDTDDIQFMDLTGYLLTVHELLMPLLYDKQQAALRQVITRVYLVMGVAFSIFDCLPEEQDQLLQNALIVSMLIQLLPEKPDAYTVAYCQMVALMLWECPLSGKQKEDVAYCYQKAKEVLGNA